MKCVAAALDMASLTMLRSAALKRAIDFIAHQTKEHPIQPLKLVTACFAQPQ